MVTARWSRPTLRDEVWMADSQGRELSVVAVGDSADAVMDELYPGLELHDADDEVFSLTGHCEPEDSFG